jgi:hypothetical protein
MRLGSDMLLDGFDFHSAAAAPPRASAFCVVGTTFRSHEPAMAFDLLMAPELPGVYHAVLSRLHD